MFYTPIPVTRKAPCFGELQAMVAMTCVVHKKRYIVPIKSNRLENQISSSQTKATAVFFCLGNVAFFGNAACLYAVYLHACTDLKGAIYYGPVFNHHLHLALHAFLSSVRCLSFHDPKQPVFIYHIIPKNPKIWRQRSSQQQCSLRSPHLGSFLLRQKRPSRWAESRL